MKVFDITPLITSQLAVFPGDTPFSREIALDMPPHHLRLSAIKTTVHLGAHADSSSHYHEAGVGVDQRPLEAYWGRALVVTASGSRNGRIYREHLGAAGAVAGQQLGNCSRVLIKTGSFPDPNLWNNDFLALSPELIDFFASQGVRLVGIDTPSVDPAKDAELLSHQALWRTQMAVLEGLVLAQVPDGFYHLVALPLPIQGADASPVRALLFAGEWPQSEHWQLIGPGQPGTYPGTIPEK